MAEGIPDAARPQGICFLDRDGVVIREEHYLADPDKVTLLPGIPEALRTLSGMGFLLAIVSNQSGVARGMFKEADVAAVNCRMIDLLQREGVTIDALRYCPHHPRGTVEPYGRDCDCRKPGTRMFDEIAHELKRELRDSVMIGDKLSDVQAGRNAGCRLSILVLTGHGAKEARSLPAQVPLCENLAEAVELIAADAVQSQSPCQKPSP